MSLTRLASKNAVYCHILTPLAAPRIQKATFASVSSCPVTLMSYYNQNQNISDNMSHPTTPLEGSSHGVPVGWDTLDPQDLHQESQQQHQDLFSAAALSLDDLPVVPSHQQSPQDEPSSANPSEHQPRLHFIDVSQLKPGARPRRSSPTSRSKRMQPYPTRASSATPVLGSVRSRQHHEEPHVRFAPTAGPSSERQSTSPSMSFPPGPFGTYRCVICVSSSIIPGLKLL